MASSQRHPEKDAAGIIRQIVNVVQACHFMGVMHRDIKHENFLFSSNDENALLKAIDFRCAVFIDKGEVYNDRVGTGCYVSPEVLQGHYGKEADICSAGVVLYILLCGQPPFVTKPEEHMLYEIQNAPIDFESHPWPCTSSAATDLVKKMLIRNPKKRITAAKVMAKNLSEEEIKGLKTTFNNIDTDKTGTVTPEEHKRGSDATHRSRELSLQSLTFLYPYNYNQHMVRTFQGDVDGNGTIDIEEFISATLDRFKLDQDEQVRLAFQHFDKDNDSNRLITRDELEIAMKDCGDGSIDIEEFFTMMGN
ncbi:hypothetical protein BRARA_I02208 [Brassica rapa]|uniref:non-specific serine/threonine protein kinase n=1 Tax=Brassica campestris TaxID=3711 RepID=A0A397XVT0_BRACM|nr:hypothetical protein BRARA_I02208 [Brassica rapa]